MKVPVRPGAGIDSSELRGWAARKSVAEDARWLMDVILSGNKVPQLVGYVPFLLGQHLVRIAYEGTVALRSANPHVGIPLLAALLNGKFDRVTESARHLTKLLDNTKKPYGDVLSEFAAELKVHHDWLTGNAVRLARWLETDIGLLYVDDALVGATVPIAYRMGLNLARPATMWGVDLNALSVEWGETLAVLGAATFDDSQPKVTLDLAGIRVISRDQRADRYLARRFDLQFPQELKLLILMIESDLNTARLVLPRTAYGHENAEFRARVVIAYHCLSALKRISDQHPGLNTPGLDGLRELLSDPAARRLLSSSGKKVRNRSVHYEMNDPTILPDLTRPMNGIVEAVCDGRSWRAFDQDIRELTNRAAEHLALWKP